MRRLVTVSVVGVDGDLGGAVVVAAEPGQPGRVRLATTLPPAV